MFDDVHGYVDEVELKKLISNRGMLEKLENYKKNSLLFDSKYTKEDYYYSMDAYVLNIVNKMKGRFIPRNFPLLANYFDFFVKNRYKSCNSFFSNPVVRQIHLIDLGDSRDEVVNFLISKRNSRYYQMLNELKKEYEIIIKNNTKVGYNSFVNIMEFFSSTRLENYTIGLDVINYIFSNMLDKKFINTRFDSFFFEYYFSMFIKQLLKKEKLNYDCIVCNMDNDMLCDYSLTPNIVIKLNRSKLGNNMKNNFNYFMSIFYTVEYIKRLNSNINNYVNLIITKKLIIREKSNGIIKLKTPDIVNSDADVRLNADVKYLHYFKKINIDFYNIISSRVLDEINNLKRNYHVDDYMIEGNYLKIESLFDRRIKLDELKYFISRFPILKFEYFEDGSKKSSLDILVTKYTLDNAVDKNLCDSIIMNQSLTLDDIIYCYQKSSVLYNVYNNDFEFDRKSLYGNIVVKKLCFIMDTYTKQKTIKIEGVILKTFIDNILYISKHYRTEKNTEKKNYLYMRINNDIDILKQIIDIFNEYNNYRKIKYNLSEIVSNLKKGLHM